MKNWQKRALRTFLQAMLGTLSTQILLYQGQELTGIIWLSVGAAAVSAGLAAIMNIKEE